jgi:hypothetical protein
LGALNDRLERFKKKLLSKLGGSHCGFPTPQLDSKAISKHQGSGMQQKVIDNKADRK